MTQFPTNPMFWYGSFSGLWVYYAVPYDLANDYLANMTKGSNDKAPFTAFRFMDDPKNPVALVNLNFMNYGAHSGINEPTAYEDILTPFVPTKEQPDPPSLGVEPATEVELSIIAYPTARAAQIPDASPSDPKKPFSVQDFILGNDLTKTLGPFRLFVPCDDRIAVYWGIKNFGEKKFMTHVYPYNIPCPNNFTGTKIWNFTIPGDVQELKPAYDPINNTCTPNILQMTVDLSCFVPSASNPSEILDYSMMSDGKGGQRPIGSRRNIFGNFNSYVFSPGSQPTFPYTIGTSQGTNAQAMISALQKLLGPNRKSVAAQVFQTQPVIAESGTYYVDV